MADAATTNRGLNDLLKAAGLTLVENGGRDFTAPEAAYGSYGPLPTWEDISLSALFLDSTRSATTKKLQEADRKDGVISLANDTWHHIDWDPEVGAFELTPIENTASDGIEVATEADVAANAGMEIPEGTTKEFLVAGSPVGRIYIRRTNAGNGGNGAQTVKVNFICYGSRKMLGSTRRVAGTAHS